MSHIVICEKGLGDGTLSEKTRKSNHLQKSLQRQHFLLRYYKTLSVGPAGIRAHDLPFSRPALSQLSQPSGETLLLSPIPTNRQTRGDPLKYYMHVFCLFSSPSHSSFHIVFPLRHFARVASRNPSYGKIISSP